MGKQVPFKECNNERFFRAIFMDIVDWMYYSYQLPHIRRKVKISDMTKEYRLVDCDVPTFYSNLFQPPNDQFRRPVQV